ncbi:MAG: AAA family ATPase [Chloroflexaceae bacterium]|nr:AAA family ATPase [Chloroflexaceae bacterium]
MLTQVSLQHFKCFEQLRLPLAPLTLLSGLNAAGKSTVLQAFTLLQQTATEGEWNTTLMLNGSSIALGTASDVIDELSGRDTFGIGVSGDMFDCFWIMKTDTRKELALPIQTIVWKEADTWQPIVTDVTSAQQRLYRLVPETIWQASEHAQRLASMLLQLTYISADRIGPRETYIVTTPDQQANVGPRGEFTAWFLHSFAQYEPLPGLQFKDTPPTLQRQAEAWMDYFFPGCHFLVQPVERANLVTLSLRTNAANAYHRPQNVGYGLTHVLPILSACLGARAGDVILIENPESHLHPAGQSEMGVFLARAPPPASKLFWRHTAIMY